MYYLNSNYKYEYIKPIKVSSTKSLIQSIFQKSVGEKHSVTSKSTNENENIVLDWAETVSNSITVPRDVINSFISVHI